MSQLAEIEIRESRKILREHVGEISIEIGAVVSDKIASVPMTRHADSNILLKQSRLVS